LAAGRSEGLPAVAPVAENFAARLDAAARRAPDRVALLWDGGSLAWAQLERRAGGFARALVERGARPGDRVALCIGNRWSLVVALWGGFKMGGTVVPLNPLLTPEERSRLFAHLGPKLVVDTVGDDEADWPSVPIADSAALILYTSGSTGQPKGAVLSHEALAF